MSIQSQLMLTDYTGNKSHLSLSQKPLVAYKAWPAMAKDSPKRPDKEGVKSSSQIPGQSSSLTSVKQDWKHQGPVDSDFHPPAQVPTAPHPISNGHVICDNVSISSVERFSMCALNTRTATL